MGHEYTDDGSGGIHACSRGRIFPRTPASPWTKELQIWRDTTIHEWATNTPMTGRAASMRVAVDGFPEAGSDTLERSRPGHRCQNKLPEVDE